MDHDAYSGSPGEGGADAEKTRSVAGTLDGELNEPRGEQQAERTMLIPAKEIQALANGAKQASPEETTVLKPVKPDDPPPDTGREPTGRNGLAHTGDDSFGAGANADPEANGFWFSPVPDEDADSEESGRGSFSGTLELEPEPEEAAKPAKKEEPEKPRQTPSTELPVPHGMVDATTKRASTFAGGRRSGNSGLSGKALFSDHSRADAGTDYHLALRGRLDPALESRPEAGPGTAPLPAVRNEDGRTRG